MAIDLKINDEKGYWDLNIENGDLAKTDSLDTAIYMSVFCEKRAEKINNQMNKRGHFTNQFSPVSGYQVGSLLWLYTEQARNTDANLSLIQSSIKDGLKDRQSFFVTQVASSVLINSPGLGQYAEKSS